MEIKKEKDTVAAVVASREVDMQGVWGEARLVAAAAVLVVSEFLAVLVYCIKMAPERRPSTRLQCSQLMLKISCPTRANKGDNKDPLCQRAGDDP